MTIKTIIKVLAALLISSVNLGANAFSISFDSDGYVINPDVQVVVTITYDFTDNPAFGGGFNVIYDSQALEFVSYTQAPFSGIGAPTSGNASPEGSLVSPGQYIGAGVGTFEFFTGINTAGAVGTFVFNAIGPADATVCGALLCLTSNDVNPVFNLQGQDITAATFANGISEANLIPVPAAIWFSLSGLIALAGFARKAA